MSGPFELTLLSGSYAICRLQPDADVPPWALAPGGLASITRTDEELSIVCAAERVPPDVRQEPGRRVLRLQGPVPLEATGILAQLSGALAHAEVAVFAISTYETDYLVVPASALPKAVRALRHAGHTVHTP
jgi:hypothetical protein